MEEGSETAAIAAFHLGAIALRQDDQQTAIENYQRVCQLYPSFGAAHYVLGILNRDRGADVDSRKHFTLAQQHRLDEPTVDDPLLEEIFGKRYRAVDYLRTGEELLRSGQPGGALEAFRHAIALDPRRLEGHVGQIKALGKLGRLDGIERHYDRAVALDPDFDQTYLSYGVVMLTEQRYAEAEGHIARALEVNPYYAEALAYRAYLLEQNGELADAISLYRQALDIQPDLCPARLRLGGLLLRQHRPRQAAQAFKAALQTDEERRPHFLREIGLRYARVGERATADDYLAQARQAATKLWPDDWKRELEKERWPLE